MFNESEIEEDNSQMVYLASVNTKILQVFSIIIPLIGMPGNTIAVFILHRQSKKDVGNFMYLKSLCLVNIVSLIVGLPRSIAKGVHGVHFIYTYLKYCTFSQWLLCTLMAVTSWLIVIINGCRLLQLFPGTKCINNYITPLAAVLITCIICAFIELFIVTQGVIYFYPLYSEPGCYLSRATPWAYIHFVLYAATPLVLLMTFNFILYYLNWKKDTLHSSSATAVAKRHLYLVIVLSSAHFVMTMFPIAFFYVLPNSFFDFNSATGRTQTMLVYNVSIIILYFGNATNYIIYTCIGKRFRKELLNILGPVCPKICSKKCLQMCLQVNELDPDSDGPTEHAPEEQRKKSRQSGIAKAINVEDMNWRYDGTYRYTSSKSAMTIGEFYSNIRQGRPGRLKSKDQLQSNPSDPVREADVGSDSVSKDWMKHRSTSVDVGLGKPLLLDGAEKTNGARSTGQDNHKSVKRQSSGSMLNQQAESAGLPESLKWPELHRTESVKTIETMKSAESSKKVP